MSLLFIAINLTTVCNALLGRGTKGAFISLKKLYEYIINRIIKNITAKINPIEIMSIINLNYANFLYKILAIPFELRRCLLYP